MFKLAEALDYLFWSFATLLESIIARYKVNRLYHFLTGQHFHFQEAPWLLLKESGFC